jgi:hypothetical protein
LSRYSFNLIDLIGEVKRVTGEFAPRVFSTALQPPQGMQQPLQVRRSGGDVGAGAQAGWLGQ